MTVSVEGEFMTENTSVQNYYGWKICLHSRKLHYWKNGHSDVNLNFVNCNKTMHGRLTYPSSLRKLFIWVQAFAEWAALPLYWKKTASDQCFQRPKLLLLLFLFLLLSLLLLVLWLLYYYKECAYLLSIITALHAMQTRSSDENSVCPSVRPSVCLSNAWIVTKRKKDMFRFLYHTEDHLV